MTTVAAACCCEFVLAGLFADVLRRVPRHFINVNGFPGSQRGDDRLVAKPELSANWDR